MPTPLVVLGLGPCMFDLLIYREPVQFHLSLSSSFKMEVFWNCQVTGLVLEVLDTFDEGLVGPSPGLYPKH